MNNIEQNFIWWVGVVEDRNDPLQIGRCRVRILGYHTDNKQDMPTDELPWAYPAMPINTPSRTTPVGPVEGTWIMGFFRDGNSAQQPVMTNIINYGYVNPDNPRVGFNDPDPNAAGRPKRPDGEDWPNVGDINTHKLSRGEKGSTWIDSNEFVDSIVTAKKGNNWGEPTSKYNSNYPYNTVNESESGHVTEIDDTPGAERLVRRHRSGTFEEIYPDGSRVVKIISKDYEIVLSEKNLYVKGDLNLTVDGDLNIKVKKNLRFDVGGQFRVKTATGGPAGAIVLQAGISADVGALGTAPILVNGVALGTNTGMPIMHGASSPMVIPAPFPIITAPDMGLVMEADPGSSVKKPSDSRQVMTNMGSGAAKKPISLDPKQFSDMVDESKMESLKVADPETGLVAPPTAEEIANAELYDPETQIIWERALVSDVIKPSKAGTKFKIASKGIIPDEKWMELGASSKSKIGDEFVYNGTPLDHTFYKGGGIGTISTTRGNPEVWKQAVQMPIPSIPPPATLPWKDRMKQHFDEATGKVVFDIHIGDLLKVNSRGMLLSVLKPIFDGINTSAQYTLEEVLSLLTPADFDKLIERLSLGTAANGIASLEKLITEVNNKVNEYKQYQVELKYGIDLNIKVKLQSIDLAKRHLTWWGAVQTKKNIDTWANHFELMLIGQNEPDENLKRLLEE